MTTDPVRPVDAATVILTRQKNGSPWECFMVRRHVRSEFAADVYVFPGGKVDPADHDPESLHVVASDSSENLLPFRIAAIRELFEEAGVLLATNAEGSELEIAGADIERFAAFRREIHGGDLSVLELAKREQLCLATDRLAPISRWITPESFPRRFDTYFFLARSPEGQEPLHDAIETTHGVWVSPAEALDKSQRGEFPLVFATERHLMRLARFNSPDAVIAATYAGDLEPVTPRVVERDGEHVFLIPGDEGY